MSCLVGLLLEAKVAEDESREDLAEAVTVPARKHAGAMDGLGRQDWPRFATQSKKKDKEESRGRSEMGVLVLPVVAANALEDLVLLASAAAHTADMSGHGGGRGRKKQDARRRARKKGFS